MRQAIAPDTFGPMAGNELYWGGPEFDLVCVVSALREHLVAHALNQRLGLNLSREITDLDMVVENGSSVAFFPVFQYEDPINQRQYKLLGNRSLPGASAKAMAPSLFDETDARHLLLPELPRTDYLLLCEGHWPEQDLNNLVLDLREVPSIATAYRMETGRLKNIGNIIL